MDGRIALLEAWLAAGLELGNHTYSHPDFNKIGLAAYQEEIVRGETVTRRLARQHGRELRLFRHTFLRTGATTGDKAGLETFLKARGYVVAPVSVENDDWYFNARYVKARADGDAALAARIGEAYLVHWGVMLDWYDALAQQTFGRRVHHVALMHQNALNADYLPRVLALMRARGLRFAPIDEVLKDPAYAHEDRYGRGLGQIVAAALGLERGHGHAGQGARPARLGDEAPALKPGPAMASLGPMRHLVLGRTGLRVSELCLGTMTFGGSGMWEALGALDQARATALVERSLEAGINFFDSADFYAAGESEAMLGKALGARRRNVVVATKVRLRMGDGVNDVGLSRSHILSAADASLKRLGTDYIDLYQVHNPDPLTPLDETLRALEDLVRWGKVRYVGASNYAAWQLMKALWIADARGFSRFESLQAYYNLLARDLERELVPMLRDQQVGLMVWSPLAGGYLAGKTDKAGKAPAGSRLEKDSYLPLDLERGGRILLALREIASGHGVSPARVALAWLLSREVVTSVIVGARSVEQLDDNLAAIRVKLRRDELERLDAASALPDEYPGWMLRRTASDRTLT